MHPEQSATEADTASSTVFENEEKFKTLFMMSVNGIICQDSAGIITDLNPSATKILGLSRKQVLGRIFGGSGWKFIKEDGQDFLIEDQPSALSVRTGKQEQAVMGMRNRILDRLIWLNVTAIPLFRPGEMRPFQILDLLEDISGQVDHKSSRNDSDRLFELNKKVEVSLAEITRLRHFNDLITDKLGLALITTSPSGMIKSSNSEAESILGYSHQELSAGKRFISLIKKEDLVKEIKILSENGVHIKDSFEAFAIQSENSGAINKEWTLIPKNGAGISVLLSVIQNKNDAGIITGYTFICLDINTKRNAETTLRRNEDQFSKMFLFHSAVMLLIKPDTGEIVHANNAARLYYGYPFSKAAGMRISDISILSREKLSELMQKASSKSKNYFVFIHKLANNELRTVEVYSTPVEFSGQILLFSIIHDISERIQIERELHFSEARWQGAVEGSGDGIWDWNLETNEVFFSHQWKTMLGNEDVNIGSSFNEWSDRIHPEDLVSFHKNIDRLLKNEIEFYTAEHRMLCNDGSYKWILERGKVIECNEPGIPSRIIGTSKDITERKQAELSLKNSIQREKELSEMKSRFVSTASHEFRTPLASILISSDALLTYWKNMDEAQIKNKLVKIIGQVNHLSDIVNDVLQLSRMEERKLEFNPVELDIIEICVQEAETFNADPMIKNRVKFKSPYNSVLMNLDPRLILQVINNLISNGIKYSSEVSEVNVEISLKNGELCISIADRGIGIPITDQQHLFEPFFRGSNTGSIQGNGLGLSIVKESIELHGGVISFTSHAGKGTTFTIRFPETLVIRYE